MGRDTGGRLGRGTFEPTPEESQSADCGISFQLQCGELELGLCRPTQHTQRAHTTLHSSACHMAHKSPGTVGGEGDDGRWDWLGRMITSGARQVLVRCHREELPLWSLALGGAQPDSLTGL